jgi:hypothetical protein
VHYRTVGITNLRLWACWYLQHRCCNGLLMPRRRSSDCGLWHQRPMCGYYLARFDFGFVLFSIKRPPFGGLNFCCANLGNPTQAETGLSGPPAVCKHSWYPALGKVREERGTRCVGSSCEIKPGHPPESGMTPTVCKPHFSQSTREMGHPQVLLWI